MNEDIRMECRGFIEEIWSSWPEPRAVPPQAEAHARGCPVCRAELESFRVLCRRSATAAGARLSWTEVLPDSHWMRLAAATRKALRARPPASRPWTWAPATAVMAAVGIALLWIASPLRKPAERVPAEVVGQMEFFDHLDLLEDWDAIESLPPDGGGKP